MSDLNNKNLELIKKQLEQILKKQEELEKRLEEIEKDLYLDNDYDLEIVCPYCNYSFILDADETNTENERRHAAQDRTVYAGICFAFAADGMWFHHPSSVFSPFCSGTRDGRAEGRDIPDRFLFGGSVAA